MAVHRLDELLAQTDPFDLAQAIERYVSTLDGPTVRALLHDGVLKAGSYYREELEQVVAKGSSDAGLRAGFIRFLKSNLRAVNLFGATFAAAVLAECPAHRVVAIGEERRRTSDRTTFIVGTAAALLLLGAGAAHSFVSARAAAQVPQPDPPHLTAVAARPAQTPVPPRPTVSEQPRSQSRHVASRPIHVAVAAPYTPPSLQPQAAEPQPQPPSYAPQAQTAPVPAPVPRRHPHRRTKTPPPGRATLTINATPAPAINASPLDAQDMPDSYSDATPLPNQSAQPAAVVGDESVGTPTPSPGPKHRSWLRRTIMHLDPLQPGAHIRIP